MTSFLKTNSQFKRETPIYKNRFFWIGIAVLLVGAALFYLVVFAPLFQVEQVEVAGNNKVDQKGIEEIVEENFPRDLFFVSSRSIFLVTIGKIKSELLFSFPVLYDVEVRRELPDGLKVSVKERKPRATFLGEKNYLLDKRGIAFQIVSSSTDFVVEKKNGRYELGEEVINKEVMNKILTIKSEVEEVKIKKAILKSTDRLDVVTEAGWKAYFDLSKDWQWQITELKVILERKISAEDLKNMNYIDLRFESTYIN